MTNHHAELSNAELTAPESAPLMPAVVPASLESPTTPFSELQSSVGNAMLVAMVTGGSPPDSNHPLSRQTTHGNSAVARSLIQRKGESESPAQNAPATTTPTQTLIVEDNVEMLQPGQMKKTDFLTQLHSSVCITTAEAFAGAQQAGVGCPYIERVFAHYATLGPQQLERGIRRYSPEVAGVTSATALIPIITARVRRSLDTWVRTGEVTGVPEGIPPGAFGAGMLETVNRAASTAVSGIANVASEAGNALSSVGNLLFKERHRGAGEAGDPQAIQAQLGAGHPLDSKVRAPMESAFGESFGDVQVHTDANAAGLSENMDARAFTVGRHIAFGGGEYQPGTLIGDALIAHELAHVRQQNSGSVATDAAQKGTSQYGSLEEDADEAAVAAVASVWSGAKKGLTQVARGAIPGLKSGLRLQRCEKERPIAVRSRERNELADLLGNPEANEAEFMRRLDVPGNDAVEILMHIGRIQDDASIRVLAASEAGQRMLTRIIQVLRGGNLVARVRADGIERILNTRRSPPSQTLTPGLQQTLDRINAAINAESTARLSQYRDRSTLVVPLRLPVELYQPGLELSGGVYYDPRMPTAPPGEAGITYGEIWSTTRDSQTTYTYPLNFIRLGPLAVSLSDEFIRSTLWHEFQHYRRMVEFRQDDARQTPESVSLEQEYLLPRSSGQPNMELEATSIQLADDFDRLRDDEVQATLRYLASHMAHPRALPSFRNAAITRIRGAVTGDRPKQDRLLRLIASLGRGDRTALNDLKQAIQANLAPRPRRRAPGSP